MTMFNNKFQTSPGSVIDRTSTLGAGGCGFQPRLCHIKDVKNGTCVLVIIRQALGHVCPTNDYYID